MWPGFPKDPFRLRWMDGKEKGGGGGKASSRRRVGERPERGAPITLPEPEVYSPGVPRPSANILKKQKESPSLLRSPPPAPWVTECTHQIFIKVLLSET